MSKRLVVLVCTFAALAGAAPPFSFQTHYLQLGVNDTSVAIVADQDGNIFIVSQIVTGSGYGRVTKTDPSGSVIGMMTLGQRTFPSGAAVDPQGNLFVVCSDVVVKLDNGLTSIEATWPIPGNNPRGTAITTDSSGNVWVTGSTGSNFPTTAGGYESSPPPGASYAFVAELSPDLSTVMHAALYGSSSADCNPFSALCRTQNGPGLPAATTPTAIALDPSGAVVIAGYANGQPAELFDFPYNYGFAAKLSGDGHAKVGVYRSSTGTWYLDANNNGVYDSGDFVYSFGGLQGDTPMVGDWTGVQGVNMHKDCIGVYRPQGYWVLDLNCNGQWDSGTEGGFAFGGLTGDVPVVGKWHMGGFARAGLVRRYCPGGVCQGNPYFWVYDGSDPNCTGSQCHQPDTTLGNYGYGGLTGDVYVTGDWNNTGTWKAGIYRNGEWVLDLSGYGATCTPGTNCITPALGGIPGDVPVTGKW